MTVGYSMRIAKQIRAADSSLLGVQLGIACLKKGISVAEVAQRVGVDKRTVYAWFTGVHDVVRNPGRSRVIELLSELDPQ